MNNIELSVDFPTNFLSIIFSHRYVSSSSLYLQTMTLQGGPVTTYPSNITLPACCEPQEFVLLCIPQKPGNLSLTGETDRQIDRQTDRQINRQTDRQRRDRQTDNKETDRQTQAFI